MNFSERVQGRQTNNTAEIRAAERAIQKAKDHGYSEVTVKTDSKFLQNSVESWMPKWKSNGWKKANGGPVQNREDFEGLDRAMKGVEVRFKYVPGHQGNYGNEQADRLAKDGARRSQ
jgi:ribonuclease HI